MRSFGRSFVYASAFCLAALTASVAPIPAAHADAEMAATIEEHESKARVFRDKAAQYRADAEQSRSIAKRYREARNSKGHPIRTPEYRKIAADYEDMARHDEALAKDAERIADFHDRQIKILKAQAEKPAE